MPSCFIAMPITTSDPSAYIGDSQHFLHVLDHLFKPAIEAAGLTPVAPMAQGADVIHAQIIAQLESADLVLCDVSGLNANVFFELGIRTALNRPICLVKDDQTQRIPFDTTLINHYTYKSALHTWDIQAEVAALADHVRVTVERSAGANALWRHFGLSIPGKAAETTSDSDSKLTLLAQQIQTLSQRIGGGVDPLLALGVAETTQDRESRVFRHIQQLAAAEEVEVAGGGWGGGLMRLNVGHLPSAELQLKLMAIARAIGYNLILEAKSPTA